MADTVTGRRRLGLPIAVGVLLMLVAGAVAWWLADQREMESAAELERAVEAYAAASAELDHAITELNTEVAAAQQVVVEVTEHEVAATELEPQVVALEEVVAESDEAVAAAAALDSAGTGGAATAADVRELGVRKSETAAGIREITQRVVVARETLVEGFAELVLQEARDALAAVRADLRTLIAAATKTLTASEGKVADDAVRVRLATSIDAANLVLAETPGATVAGLAAQTDRTGVAKTELTTAEAAVVDAQRAWEDEQAAAAEAAEATAP